MSEVTGGIKFFDQSFSLFKRGTTATATSNNDGVNAILDISRYTQWESVGSNDLTTETLVITLRDEIEIDTLLLTDFNFKNFNIKYNSSGSFINFTNVFGVNNTSSANISETDFSYSSAFYTFDAVTTTQIQIECDETQISDAEKFLGQFIATKEIGTFLGFPRINPESDRNETKAVTLSRRYIVQKTYETNKIKINFKTHPYQNDITIVENLFNREDPFLVYPCGGRTGENFFKVSQKSWKLDDIFNMQIIGKIKNDFEKGVYTLGFNKTLTLVEHI